MKTLENLNSSPYAIEVEVNGVTHNVLPNNGYVGSDFKVNIQSLVPKDMVLLSTSRNGAISDSEMTCPDIAKLMVSSYDGAMLIICPSKVGSEFINFYQKMVGNKLVITLTPKQHLDLFTFDIAYEIVPK